MTDVTGENSGNCKNRKSDEGGKGGKLQPKLRFKGFTDAWEQRALGELATFAKGAGYSKSDLVGKGKPIILYGRLYTDYQTIIHDVNTFVIDRPGSIYSVGNEVIVPASGETAEDIARASVVCRAGIILGGDLNIIYPKPSLSSVFLALVISNGKEHVKLARKAQGKSIVHIHNNDLKYIRISYPDIREQMTVSHLFRCFDCLIAAAERKVLLLKKKKHAYLNHIFTQHLRFTGHTTPWQTKKLGELEREQKIRLGRGKVISENDITSTPGKYPIYSSSARNNGEMGRYGLWMFNQELVTWSIDGGGSVFYRPKHRFSITNVCGFVQVLTNIDCPFLAYQMMYIHNKIHFDYTVKAHPSVIRKLYFLGVPSIEEQIKIGNFFQTLDSLITATERKVNLLKKKKQAYLQRMFI